MKIYARFHEDGRVAETHVGDPSEAFVKEIADLFLEVPEGTKTGDKKTDKGWEPYVEPEARPVELPVLVGELSLKRFMTRSERLAYKSAAQSDPIIADFAEMLSMGDLKLNDAETIEAIDKLAELKVLTAARATELKELEG